jgi:endoglucanase
VTLDHLYWMRPEDMGTMERPAFYVDASMPGTDLLASASAALAASSMAFASQNREYAGALLKESQALYSFASAYLGSYSKWIPTEGQYYSDSYYDDLAWAAAWIYKASGSGQYLKESENWYQMHFKMEEPQAGNMVFDFARSATGVDLLLAQSTNKAVYVDRIEKFLNQWMTGKGVSYTEKGLAMIPPNGTLQYTANAAMLAVLYGKIKTGNSLEYNCWTRKQIAYMLGDTGQSYVVGFGNGSPKKVPHRGASCPDPGDGVCNWQTGYLNTNINPHILYGALVGGPDKMDNFWDDRSWNSTMNRVSLLNNAGFTAAIAGLKSQGVSEAKCQQGTGLIQEAVKKSQGVRY